MSSHSRKHGSDRAAGSDRKSAARGPGLAILGLVLFGLACANAPAPRWLAYSSDAFREEVLARVPEIGAPLARPPFEIDAETVERARDAIEAAPLGPPRVQALVDFLMKPEPEGLGLVYDWSVSANATRTLELRRGNCFAMASVMVGLGRGLGWPIYYAEARPREPETLQFEEVRALSDHMVVLIVAKTVKQIVDFTGLLKEGYDVEPISDLRAYAHLVNNVSGQRVMNADRASSEAEWQAARQGFELATRIDPSLGRAWNNLGIVYRRLGRIEEARAAYQRALALDAGFGSAEHNLSLMETRSGGTPSLIQTDPP
ncbi:MAG: tetratricopeptide repeat protein [Myxococcota bacterium]